MVVDSRSSVWLSVGIHNTDNLDMARKTSHSLPPPGPVRSSPCNMRGLSCRVCVHYNPQPFLKYPYVTCNVYFTFHATFHEIIIQWNPSKMVTV